MARIKGFFNLLGLIAQPWLCVIVYLWALELRAAVGTESEPVSAWLADCGAILLTLTFWTFALCLALSVCGMLTGRRIALGCSTFAAKVAFIAVTALHLIRWLVNWRSSFSEHDAVLIFLFAASLVFAIWVLLRRKKALVPQSTPLDFADCFYFGALPVLLGVAVFTGARVAGYLVSGRLAPEAIAGVSSKTENSSGHPNVILVVSDALRAASMSLYGHSRETTPQLERWAKRATVFLQMHSNSTSTKPSITTILSGKHPFSHGRLTKGQPPYRASENLLQALRALGYTVAAVTSNEDASLNLLGFGNYVTQPERPAFEFLSLGWLREHGIYPTPTGGRVYQSLAQFLPFIGYPARTSYYGFADTSLDNAEALLSGLKQPFFLFVHIHEPHDPYDSSSRFKGRYSSPEAGALRKKIPSSYYSRYGIELQPAVDAYRDQYEESISFLDAELGRFLGDIERLQWANSLLVILTGDHGESFERGFMNHGEDLYETSTHVPLVIRFPGQQQGARIRGLVQSIDIAPTILSVAGISVPAWMDGQPLRPNEAPKAAPAVTINFKDAVGQRSFSLPTKLAIWSKDYKMIVNCDSPGIELYDLSQDPRENLDLSNQKAGLVDELTHELRERLQGRWAKQMESCVDSNNRGRVIHERDFRKD
ncbi:MAG: sulfatase [Alphaproteobacteria bacterium]